MARALAAPLASLPDPLRLPALGGAFDATITPPGSKSLTNRALLLAALAGGESTLRGALTEADDAKVMLEALRALSVVIAVSGDTVKVVGGGGRFGARAPVTLDLGNAGTATRFLAAAALLCAAPVTIDGDPRMRERPIGALALALAALGARVEWLGREGFPPLRVTPPSLAATPSEVRIASAESGQFVSALLLIAPFLPKGLTVRVDGAPTSPPYIEMTLRLLRRVGAEATWSDDLREMRVAPMDRSRPSPLRDGLSLDIEPDASGAGYFWAAAALVPGASCLTPGIRTPGIRTPGITTPGITTPGIATPGITPDSLQGDARLVDLLASMGATVERSASGVRVRGGSALRAIDADLSGMPDAAMTLAALACFADGVTTLRGLRTLRVKETDRLEALRVELTKLGASVEVIGPTGDEGLRIAPPDRAGSSVFPARAGECPPIEFETYHDHRMAMSLALVALRRPGIRIRNPSCVAKTYPRFWADFASLFAG